MSSPMHPRISRASVQYVLPLVLLSTGLMLLRIVFPWSWHTVGLAAGLMLLVAGAIGAIYKTLGSRPLRHHVTPKRHDNAVVVPEEQTAGLAGLQRDAGRISNQLLEASSRLTNAVLGVSDLQGKVQEFWLRETSARRELEQRCLALVAALTDIIDFVDGISTGTSINGDGEQLLSSVVRRAIRGMDRADIREIRVSPGESPSRELHKIVGSASSPYPEGRLVTVLRRGFILEDGDEPRCLRAAEVVVSSGPTPGEQPAERPPCPSAGPTDVPPEPGAIHASDNEIEGRTLISQTSEPSGREKSAGSA